MKHLIYITAFTLLGVLLQFILHAVIETWYIGLLLADFPRYGFGLSWEAWERIHHALTGILFVGGLVFGYFSGRFWWQKLYVEGLRFKHPAWFRKGAAWWDCMPTSWQGWLVLALYLALITKIFIRVDANSHSVSNTLIGFSVPFIVLTSLFLFISYKAGGKSR